MNDISPALDAPAVTVSESAARRIAELVAGEGIPNLKLRLAVSGGGCSGFQYGFTFDDQVNGDDRVFVRDQAEVVIDESSLGLLAGAEIDFVEDLAGSAFKIVNPNAQSSCGCGNSFAI